MSASVATIKYARYKLEENNIKAQSLCLIDL